MSTQPLQSPAWINYTGGDTLTAAIVDRRVVYIGGHQRWLNNSYGRNSAGPGAVTRQGIAALDPANGLPLSWNPGRSRGYGVYGFALTTHGLWVGSDTAALGGEQRARLGLFPSAGGTSLPAYAAGRLPARLLQLGAASTSQVKARLFNGKAFGAPKGVATSTAWRNVRGAFVVDNTLYSAWSDRTLRASPLKGGPLTRGTAINRRRAFPEIAKVRTMFFDASTRRLYYNLAGSKALFYRYFQPESQLVGSWRYRAADTSRNWSAVRGTFIARRHLYYVNQAIGRLYKVRWQATGRTIGKSTVVGKASLRSGAMVLTPRNCPVGRRPGLPRRGRRSDWRNC